MSGARPRRPSPPTAPPSPSQANIELPADMATARSAGAAGIGLYRSEFLLATTSATALTEDAQFEAYRALVEGMAPAPVTVRTFDVDDTQVQPWAAGGGGPFGAPRASATRGALGLRAVRLSLAMPDLFRVQLRALLRASRHGRLRIMFPFVSGVEDLRAARAALREAAGELASRGEAVDLLPPVGVMIEIPSAAVTADLLAKEADFFSIGTNDLIQYVLAVDRTDARVSRLFEPLHPAVLRTLRHVIRAAARRQLPVSLCGEMAADPAILPLLIGLGLTSFSMSPAAIGIARTVVEQLDTASARRLASRVMRQATVAGVERCLAGPPGHRRPAADPVNSPRHRRHQWEALITREWTSRGATSCTGPPRTATWARSCTSTRDTRSACSTTTTKRRRSSCGRAGSCSRSSARARSSGSR